MKNNQRTIKRDLLYLYEILYTNKKSSLLDKKVVNRLKYSPEEIEQALELKEDGLSSNRSNSNKKEIPTIQITNIDQLRSFYESDLKPLYNHTIDEKIKKEILNSISLDELKRLYAIISTVPISNNTTKKEIVDMLRYYFRDESRTKSLMKNI